MAVVNFVPDPTQPYGSGTFTSDQGRTWYAHDPDMARSVVTPDTGDANSDMQGGGAPVASTPDPNSSQPPAPEVLASNAGQVAPPAGAPPAGAPPTPKAGSGGADSPEVLAQKAANVVKRTNSTSFGRKAENVNRDVAALDTAEAGTEAAIKQKAAGDEQRQNASIGSGLDYQTQAQENEQQRAQDAAQNKAKLQAKIDEINATSDATVDPDRFVSNLGTGGQIGMAILAMVSGFAQGGGAALAHTATPTDNPVVGILQRRIAADIESQKTQIESGRIRKGNILASLREQLGDEKSAELMATSLMNQAAANKAQLTAQKLNLEGAALDSANVAIAGLQQNATVARNAAYASGENHYAASSEHETKPAAGANGEAQTKAWQNYKNAIDEGADPNKAYQESGLKALGISQPTGQSKEQRAEATKAGERDADQGKARGAADSLSGLGDAAQIPTDRKTGLLRVKPGEADQPLEAGWLQRSFRSLNPLSGADATGRTAKDKSFEASRDATVQSLVAMGIKAGDAEDLLDAKTKGDLAERLNNLAPIIRSRLSPSDRAQPGAVPSSWK